MWSENLTETDGLEESWGGGGGGGRGEGREVEGGDTREGGWGIVASATCYMTPVL